MNKPFPPVNEGSERARAVRRLRRAIDAALQEGTSIARDGSPAAAEAQALLARLEEIARELDRMRGPPSGPSDHELHPFWTDILRRERER